MVAVIECCGKFACRWRLVEERIQGRLLDSGVEVLSVKIDGAERAATTRTHRLDWNEPPTNFPVGFCALFLLGWGMWSFSGGWVPAAPPWVGRACPMGAPEELRPADMPNVN